MDIFNDNRLVGKVELHICKVPDALDTATHKLVGNICRSLLGHGEHTDVNSLALTKFGEIVRVKHLDAVNLAANELLADVEEGKTADTASAEHSRCCKSAAKISCAYDNRRITLGYTQQLADFAVKIFNSYSSEELFRIISTYGEERWASRIVNFIIQERSKKSIDTTFELVDIIKAAIPLSARKDGPHPAKRTFQAIRIEVNGELKILEQAARDGAELLKKGGRMSVITFHSLEDRIIKTTFASLEKGCICPKDFPVCVCGNKPMVKSVTRKPLVPTEKELEENPRARSSKLRSIEKII